MAEKVIIAFKAAFNDGDDLMAMTMKTSNTELALNSFEELWFTR